LSFGIWRIYLGPTGLNIGIIILGLIVLVLAIAKKLSRKETKLFEISFLLFLVGFLYFTLHGRVLQLPFPISLPEIPLVDNNLTFNYASTSLLTFLVFPVSALAIAKRDVSFKSLGLTISDSKKTVFFGLFGIAFNVCLFLVSHALFGFRWIAEYTFDGLVLWILLVSVLSVFTQSFFFVGVLFNRYLNSEHSILLAIVSILAFQMFVSATLLWIVIGVIGSVAKIVVTYKTRSIYGATLMSIASNIVDIFVEIL
jgi:hypothetical protein